MRALSGPSSVLAQKDIFKTINRIFSNDYVLQHAFTRQRQGLKNIQASRRVSVPNREDSAKNLQSLPNQSKACETNQKKKRLTL